MPSRGQAAFLTFCSLVSLACLGLVLSIAVPDIGEKWYLLTIFSPLAYEFLSHHLSCSSSMDAYAVLIRASSLSLSLLVAFLSKVEIKEGNVSGCRGVYYWTRASRKEQIQVKIIVADDESSTDVIVQGDDEQIDRLRRELSLMEKGMVYVKGLFEQ